MKQGIIFLVTILLTAPAIGGQTVNKCPSPDGKPVYQQNSCAGESGTELRIETGKPSESRLATQEEIDQCLKLIKIRYDYKDPDSLRVEGSSVVVLSVNGKNSYGAYVGAKPAVCKYKASGDLDNLVAF